MIEVRPGTASDIALVAAMLCDDDMRELSCTRNVRDFDALVEDAVASEYCKVVTDAGLPVMAFGAKRFPALLDPQLAFVWAFRTDLGWRAARAVTKHVRRLMIPALRTSGVSRAACFVHRENGVSCRWLAHLGFTPKATFAGIGTPHRDLILYFRDDADAA
jgi:hypothetical protein